MKRMKTDKRITICMPQELIDKFQEACDFNYKSMSEAVRDLAQSYIGETYAKRLAGPVEVIYSQDSQCLLAVCGLQTVTMRKDFTERECLGPSARTSCWHVILI